MKGNNTMMDFIINGRRANHRALSYNPAGARLVLARRGVRPENIEIYRHPATDGLYLIVWVQ